MPAEQSQKGILEKAERLAANLAGGTVKVTKNVLLGIVAEFLSSPRPDRERLRRTLQLLHEGSGGQVKRGGGYGDQVRLAVDEVSEALSEDLTDTELKSLFGWTARLLLVRRVPVSARPSSTLRERPGEKGRGGRQDSQLAQQKTAPGRLAASLDKKSMSALEKLKEQLENKSKKGP